MPLTMCRRFALAFAPLVLLAACAGDPAAVYVGEAAPPTLDVAGFASAEAGVALAGRPDPVALTAAADAGYRTVVNLQTVDEGAADEAVNVAALGMRHVHIPITGPRVTAAAADELAGVLSDAGAHPVLVHCKSGQRAAGVYALFLQRHRELTIDEALARGTELGLSKSEVVDAVRAAADDGAEPR